MTCPKCHQQGGHYLGCEMLDEEHVRIRLRSIVATLIVVGLIVAVMWFAGDAEATPSLDEDWGISGQLYWQDGFNVPEGHHIAEVAPAEVEAPVVADWGQGVEMWRPLVVAAFPASEVETAMCVMRGESSGNPGARNPSGASGLFQVMPFWAYHYDLPQSALMIPEVNVNVAAAVWDLQGWEAWSWWKRGNCR